MKLNLIILFIFAGGLLMADQNQTNSTSNSRLAVLWTSGDPEVAHKVCFMYTHNAHNQMWFDEVRLIVWGPSQRLLVGDVETQKAIKAMLADGLKVEACIACANSYGIANDLKALGLEVKGMGVPLSDYLKNGWKVLTF